jgi:phosphoribosylformylglycinamidine synthase
MEEIKITPQLVKEHGLTEDEYQRILKHLGREPSYTELGLFSVMWSEHCSYKSSRVHLKNLPTRGKRVVQGPGENAGVIDIGDGYAIAFKIESHNHPSQVEPYQGAATGVGGIIRDVFTMGARPIASLDSLRFGDLKTDLAKRLLSGVVSGIAGYGNCMGIPTVGGEVNFDPSYAGNCLVNAMCVGLVKSAKIVKAIAKGEGNPIIYVGSTTGRDGIHGASLLASAEFTEESKDKRPNVQVGDPFLEKLLLEACLELIDKDLIVGMQDMGAAGLISSSSEMATRGKSGIRMNLDKVPRREPGMIPYEIMLSESQERMLVCGKKGKEEEIRKIFEKWDLKAEVIGEVTNTGRLEILDQGKVVADVPVHALTEEAPLYNRPYKEPTYIAKVQDNKLKVTEPKSYNKALLNVLNSPNIGSKKWVYRQYDHQVRTNSTVLPEKGDAGVLRIKENGKYIALTTDGNGRYCYLNPRQGAKLAVAEAARNLACVGADALAITNCLNFGNPEKPEIMWQFKEALEGMGEACKHFDTPVTGGNVSFYNETNGKAIFPTPVIGMLGIIDPKEFKNPEVPFCTEGFKDDGDVIVLLGETKEDMGGSEYLYVHKKDWKAAPPALDLDAELNLHNLLRDAIRKGLVKSAHDCSDGGLAITLAECCLTGKLGAEIQLPASKLPLVVQLFSETQSRAVVTAKYDDVEALEALAKKNNTPCTVLGKVQGHDLNIGLKERGTGRRDKVVSLSLDDLQKAFDTAINL